jgi:hypothetical protein
MPITDNEVGILLYESRDVSVGRQRLQDMARNGDHVSRLAWCAIADVAYTHAKNLEQAAERHGIDLHDDNADSLLPVLWDRAMNALQIIADNAPVTDAA